MALRKQSTPSGVEYSLDSRLNVAHSSPIDGVQAESPEEEQGFVEQFSVALERFGTFVHECRSRMGQVVRLRIVVRSAEEYTASRGGIIEPWKRVIGGNVYPTAMVENNTLNTRVKLLGCAAIGEHRTVQYQNVVGMVEPRGYCDVARDGNQFYVGGTVAFDEQRRVTSPDLESQVKIIIENLGRAAQAIGGTPRDIDRLRIFAPATPDKPLSRAYRLFEQAIERGEIGNAKSLISFGACTGLFREKRSTEPSLLEIEAEGSVRT